MNALIQFIEANNVWKRLRWATCVAVDEDGYVWAFESRPNPNTALGIWDVLSSNPARRHKRIGQFTEDCREWVSMIVERP